MSPGQTDFESEDDQDLVMSQRTPKVCRTIVKTYIRKTISGGSYGVTYIYKGQM